MSWRQLKHYCDGPPQYGLNVGSDQYVNSGIRLLRTTDIRENGTLRPASEGVCVRRDIVESRHVLKPGDLLFSRAGSLGRCLRVPKTSANLTFAGYLVRFRPLLGTDARYLEYCASATFFKAAIESEAITSTISNFNAERYGNLAIPDQTQEEQRLIADFLDAETVRIDALITKKRRLITLIADRLRLRASELTQHGSQLPARRALAAVQTGATPGGINERFIRSDGEVEWVSPVDVRDGLIMGPSLRRIALLAVETGVTPAFPRGSVVIVGIGATAGKVAHLNRFVAGNQQMTCLVTNSLVEPRFLAWQLFSRTEELRGTAPYTTLPILNNDFLRSIPLHVPAISNQRQVVEILDAEFGRSAHLEQVLTAQISLLRERRQALITAAVTGQIEIPGAAA